MRERRPATRTMSRIKFYSNDVNVVLGMNDSEYEGPSYPG